ncbi:hypothetical protein [Faecalibacter rhinopitheci]|nr:hypothetical protein [Faecalibacter rhinopitheci]
MSRDKRKVKFQSIIFILAMFVCIALVVYKCQPYLKEKANITRNE